MVRINFQTNNQFERQLISKYLLIFQTDKTRTQLLRDIANKFQINLIMDDADIPNENRAAPAEPTKSSFVKSLLAKHLRPTHEAASSLDEEVQRFTNQNHNDDEALEFWRKNATNFPRLAAMAKVLLAIPATSASSESAFSVAGCLLRSRRASIAPHKVQKVLFIHDNYDLLKL